MRTLNQLEKMSYVLELGESWHILWSPYGIGRPFFHAVVCSFFFFFFLSSPNLSRRRLDVCHTSTHGVALVRI